MALGIHTHWARAKRFALLGAALSLVFALASCQQEGDDQGRANGEDEGLQTQEMYRAELSGLNTEYADAEVSGTATVEIRNDSATITLDAQGLAPGMMHMAHYHGFPDGQAAQCPSPEQDQNDDGIVDMNEATQAIGDPLIPFTQNPTQLNVQSEDYPVADSSGRLFYTQTVALADLRNTLQQEHGISDLDFSNFVVNIHGIQDTTLPQSVQGMPGVPAHMTVPVACGKFEQESGGEVSLQMNGRTQTEPNDPQTDR